MSRAAATLLACALGALAATQPVRAAAPPSPATAPALSPPAPQGLERLTLREALDRARARNVSVLLAAAEIRRAAAVVVQVRAAALPTLSGGVLYTRLDNDRSIGDQVFVSANQLQANLLATVPLLAPPRWAAWAEAAEGRQVAAASAAEVQRRVAIATAHAYLAVLSARRQVELGERARDTARAHADYSQRRLQGGVGSQLDEVRAAQELGTAEARLESLQAVLLRAQGALGVLIGEARAVDAAEEPALPLPEEAPGGAAQEDLAGRADLASLAAQRRAAEHLVRHAFTFFLPSVVGTFAPLYQNPATLVQPALAWQAQLSLSLPLYDGGLRYGVTRERAARRDQAEATLSSALRQARVEVDVGRAALARAERAVTAARQAAELGRKALGIAELAYRAGATTNLELIDAQRRSRDADTAAAVAEDDARQARLDLLAAMGRFP